MSPQSHNRHMNGVAEMKDMEAQLCELPLTGADLATAATECPTSEQQRPRLRPSRALFLKEFCQVPPYGAKFTKWASYFLQRPMT